MNTNKSSLLFSNQCVASTRFITLLQNEGILKYFDMINVVERNIPNVKTPTVVFKGCCAYEGKDAFIWLEKIKESKRMNVLKEQENKMSKYFNGNNNTTKFVGYSKDEMSDSNDIYAYCNNDDNVALPGRYVSSNMVGNDLIIISGLENMKNMNIEKGKITEKKQKELLSKYTENREKQDKEIQTVYKKIIDEFNSK